jgi:hypothetical protein
LSTVTVCRVPLTVSDTWLSSPSGVAADTLSRSEHPVTTPAAAAPVAAEAAMNVRRDSADSGFPAGGGASGSGAM